MIRRDWIRRTSGVAVASCVGLRPRRLTASRTAATPLFALRNPGCGCCVGWADHLRDHGFEVHLHDSPDLTAVKERLGIEEDLHGCHTGIVEGYVIEGHVPAEFVRRVLDESPDVAGIAVPGMPIGSPGMEGAGARPYDVIAFGAPGEPSRYVFGTATPA